MLADDRLERNPYRLAASLIFLHLICWEPITLSYGRRIASRKRPPSFDGAPGYTFSILADYSGGASVDPATGVYTAGKTSGVKDTVRVPDADGNTADATVSVINPIF